MSRHPLAYTHCIHGVANNKGCIACEQASDRMKHDLLAQIDRATPSDRAAHFGSVYERDDAREAT